MVGQKTSKSVKIFTLENVTVYTMQSTGKLSVCLSICTFLVVCFLAMAAWIDVRLAQRDSYVFWYDQVYF